MSQAETFLYIRRMRIFPVIVLLVFVQSVGLSQSIRRFRHLDVNMGLAHTDAVAMTSDELGFIWIGTNSGLQRFDGSQTRLFFNSTSKLNAVYNNRITSLQCKGHRLWVGSEGGLHLF